MIRMVGTEYESLYIELLSEIEKETEKFNMQISKSGIEIVAKVKLLS